MNGNFSPLRLPLWLMAPALALLAPALHAQNATQNVNLVAGWNAVWLEVEPQDATGQPLSPSSVFNTAVNTGITVIASPKPLAGLAEFFGDAPGTESGTFNQDGWEHWRRIDPPSANNLVMTTGNRAYLIECSANLTIPITGKARFFRPKWTPDRFTLVGFGIDGTVLFSDFFASTTTTHPLAKIYTLGANGTWATVAAGSNITDGKAYWIFSAGPSDFMGPVAVDFDSAFTGKLNFGGPDDAQPILGPSPAKTVAGTYDIEEVVLTNRRTTGVTPSLTRLIDDQVVLTETLPDPAGYTRRKGNDIGASHSAAEMPAGSSILSLGASASRQWPLPAERTNLYRLKTGGGNAVYLPVSARNSSLPSLPNGAPTASTSVGLWVGEANVNAVTSIVENGEPVRPSAGSAPVRVILHSDAGGAVRLLSQVTVMQTKTADAGLEPTPVLVVDAARIPFFDGIKERNGKRAGQRIESVAYDMPRKFDGASQADLLGGLTKAGEPTFLTLPGLGLAEDLQTALASAPSIRTPAQTALITTFVTPVGGIAPIDAFKASIPGLLPDFLNARAARPAKLQEVYGLSWPLTGEVGSGKSVTTATPLNLDPFHRGNPFRHAFHKSHVRGPNIIRTITIAFDPGQTIPGRLSGTFTDTLQGLTTTDITLTGRIEMRRLSAVATLEGAP